MSNFTEFKRLHNLFYTPISVASRKDLFNSITSSTLGSATNDSKEFLKDLNSYAATPLVIVGILIIFILITRPFEKMAAHVVSIHLAIAKKAFENFESHHPVEELDHSPVV